MRALLLVAHRWAGLTITLALVVTGLTGAILPFQREIGHWVASDIWHVAPPSPGTPLLSGVELMRRVEAQTGGMVRYMPLVLDPDQAQAVFVSPRPDGEPLGYSEVFADPYTGAIRARVRYGDLRDGAINLMPFLISFHYSLAAGPTGRLVLGAAALIWCGVCVLGFFLSLPRRRAGAGLRDGLRRWWPAWRVRAGQGPVVATYDFHRASGLWLWPAMLVFAWSAVAFNLDEVHQPVQRFFGAEGLYRPVANPAPAQGAAMAPEQAVAVGGRLMAEQAGQHGFAVHAPGALSFNDAAQAIGYYARTSLDGSTEQASTVVWFDQASGKFLEFRPPYGTTRADALDKGVRMLHTAALFGWPYKLFVSAFGLLTAGMAIAGFTLWARRLGRRQRKTVPVVAAT